jgi:hypothetical protein
MTKIPDHFWAGYGNDILDGARGGNLISIPCRMKSAWKWWKNIDSRHSRYSPNVIPAEAHTRQLKGKCKNEVILKLA